MKIIKQENQEAWDKFIESYELGSFMQSWNWGEFQKKYGYEIMRLGCEHDGRLLAVVLVLKYDMPYRQSYFYSPRGPLIRIDISVNTQRQVFDAFSKYLAEQGEEIFWRVDPAYNSSALHNETSLANYIQQKGKLAFKQMQPQETLLIDITASEEDLLGSMKSKTRYNIRLAGRKGVEVSFSRNKNAVAEFCRLAGETSARDGFSYHVDKYYYQLLENLDENAEIALAKHNNKIIAANIIFYFGDTAIYAHGTSSNQSRNLMPTYILQWESIRRARKRDFKRYDFYGIATGDSRKASAWAGVTRFKQGFVPQKSPYRIYRKNMGAYDLLFKKLKYSLISSIRRIK